MQPPLNDNFQPSATQITGYLGLVLLAKLVVFLITLVFLSVVAFPFILEALRIIFAK